MGKLRANKSKHKKRSCSLCKPHKMGWGRNRKSKEFSELNRLRRYICGL